MSDIGETLRNARHKRGLSLDEVSAATRIKLSYLEALENGDYNLLPGPAYVTGFLRNYARSLGLYPEEIVQEYAALRPPPPPAVRPATRVLASGYERQNRKRIFWTLAAIVILLLGGYAVKQYADNTAAHAYSPPLNVTPANLGTTTSHHQVTTVPRLVRVRLIATAPVWVRVTVDGRRRFQGILRPNSGRRLWQGHHTIYVVTYDGVHLRAVYNGRSIGRVARAPGLAVDLATRSGWQHAA